MKNNGGRYKQVHEGEWSMWNRRGNRMQCCDCALVHIVDFRLTKSNRIEYRVRRDDSATNRIRKRNGIVLKRVNP